jgi:hypothetical protein
MYVSNKRVDTSYYQHHFPRGIVEEERDPRRFNSLEEAEQFAKDVRRANRIFHRAG